MADNIRAKCSVVVVEECDEGFSHIESGIGKILGGTGDYTVSGAYRYYYDATTDVSTSGDLIADGAECIDGTVIVAADDLISFLYVRNTDSSADIHINLAAGAQASVLGDIQVPAGDSVYFKLYNANPADVHAKSNAGTAVCEVFAVIDTAPGA